MIPEDSPLRQTVEIINPLGEDYSIMRTHIPERNADSLATNYNRRNKGGDCTNWEMYTFKGAAAYQNFRKKECSLRWYVRR